MKGTCSVRCRVYAAVFENWEAKISSLTKGNPFAHEKGRQRRTKRQARVLARCFIKRQTSWELRWKGTEGGDSTFSPATQLQHTQCCLSTFSSASCSARNEVCAEAEGKVSG